MQGASVRCIQVPPELLLVRFSPNTVHIYVAGSEVVASGQSAYGLILHSTANGTWTPTGTNATGPFFGVLRDVWGNDFGDVYAVGGDLGGLV